MTRQIKKRIGVITGGGDCPGLNAVIRAVVKHAINEFDLEVVGFLDGFRGLVLDKHIQLYYDTVSDILDKGGTILGSSNRDNPFAFYLSDAQEEPQDLSDLVVDNYEKNGLSALVCIGGDGTLSMAHQFEQRGLKIVGIPKTIDNDVQGTERAVGFESAIGSVTWAIDRIRTTAQSHHRVLVLETMGRTAGWLALLSGIAGGGDVILIPEIPFRLETVFDFIRMRNQKGKRYSIICVAEGAKLEGREILQEEKNKRTGMVRLGGIAELIAEEITEQTSVVARPTILGHVQRGGSPVPADRILATRFGSRAMEFVADGHFGVAVALQGGEISAFPLDQIVDNPRTVPADSEYIRIARSVGTCLGN